MAGKVHVVVQLTTTNTDALSGTDLERAPDAGILIVYAASTVSTATGTVVVGLDNIVRNVPLALRTNGLPNMSDDAPVVEMAVGGGEKIVVNIGGTTGTVVIVA